MPKRPKKNLRGVKTQVPKFLFKCVLKKRLNIELLISIMYRRFYFIKYTLTENRHNDLNLDDVDTSCHAMIQHFHSYFL